ncbi:hypothetical protein NBRC116583_01350 [Arenicella sp. 4NH20-0111]|uniref:NUDIX hydrolase n=1 Tax=Arenicella sp. 4NH20-0111 TaxID=3127648 RepID=UPI00310B76FB
MHQLDQTQLQLIRDYQPKERVQQTLMKAAVTLILRDTKHGTEVLLMQRAFHPKDPWSGQMSFPGGKIETTDESSRAAAEREAFEEVGAKLNDQDYVGRLDDLYGLKVNDVFSVHIACFVYKVSRDLELVANEEVADMVWLPFQFLNDRKNAHDFVHPSEPSLAMPAVMINAQKSQILWGLSLRMLSNLHVVLNQPMAVLSKQEHAQLREIEKRELSEKVLEKIQQELDDGN